MIVKLANLLKSCLVSYLIWFSIFANAEYRFNDIVLSKQEGEFIITAMIKDHHGYVWLGTNNGLYRYDGYQSITYLHQSTQPNSLSNNYITSLHQQQDGFIWVGTKNGLNLFDIRKQTFHPFYHQQDNVDSISHNVITAIESGEKNRLWIATGGGGLNLFTPDNKDYPITGHFEHIKHEPGKDKSISNNFITSLLKDSSGILWLGTGSGLDGITMGRVIHINSQTKQKLSADDISVLFEDNTGAIWVGTTSGTLDKLQLDLNQRDNLIVEPVSLVKDGRSFAVNDIIQDKLGQLWIGTFGGGLQIVNINHNKVKYVSNTQTNHLQSIISLMIDDQQLIWLGSDKGIVSQYDTNKERFGHIDVGGRNVTAISSDKQGKIWAGTESDGIAILNSNGQVGSFINTKAKDKALLDNQVKFIFKDKQDSMWVGTAKGLQRFDSRGKLVTIEGLAQITANGQYNSNIFFNTMAQDKDGRLWFGSNYGVFIKQGENQPLLHFTHQLGDVRTLSHNNVNAIFVASLGSVWVGTSNGLNRYLPNVKGFARFDKSSGLSHEFINSINQTHENILWIGTDHGLNRLTIETSNIEKIYTKSEEDIIYGVLSDEQDNLWLSSDSGLSQFNDVNKTDKDLSLDSDALIHFTVFDGLQSREFNPSAYYKTQQGELIFGGSNGINKFYASNIKLPPPPSKIVITDLLLLNRSVRELSQNDGLIELDYSQNVSDLNHFELNYHYNLVAFEFSALNFASPEQIRYRYRLKGLDRDWIEADATIRRATYTNLSSGDYRLQLNASNLKGQWSEHISEVSVSVSPAPWRSIWAYLFYSLVFFIILLTLYYLRLEHNKVLYTQKLNRTLEKRVVERTIQLQRQKDEVEILIAERTEQLERSNQSIVSMSEICSHISSTLGFEQLLVTAYSHIKELMDADIFLIGLFEPKQELVEFQLIVDKNRYSEELAVSLDETNRPAIWCYLHQQPLIINNMNQEYGQYFDRLPEPPPTASQPVKSILYWPLIVGGQIIGVLSVQSYKAHAYHTYQQHMIQTLASTTAIALDHARAYREVERQKDAVEQKVEQRTRQLQHRTKQLQQINLNITAVRHICNQISSNLNMKELPYQVYTRIRELMDTDVFMIGLYDKDEQKITFDIALKNNQQITSAPEYMHENDRPAVWCIKNQMPMIVNDLNQDMKHYFGDISVTQRIPGQVVESFVYWPLIVGKNIIGIITVQSHVKAAYNEHHQDMIATIAATTAVALDNASAYREVEHKNKEILRTQNNLVQSEKLASLGTLTAGVAHEINNPTNFVHVSAENLEVDLADFHKFIVSLAGDNADETILASFDKRFAPLYKHISTIKDGTIRIKTIVKDLRAFTHVDVENKKTVNIINTINSTINLAFSRYKETADVHTNFEDTLMLSCYPAQLSQVFMNLIVNACDAIKDKLIKTEAPALEKGNIHISCEQTDNHVIIRFKDDGCGMDELTQTKLFEPFYTTKDVGEGTGLGLSISYGIIEKHQGKLEVESTLGEGSEFRVILPKK